MFNIKYFLKIFAITLLATVLLVIGFMLVLLSNQQTIANRFMQELQKGSAVHFQYEQINFSITQNFPFASIGLRHFVAFYPSNGSDTLVAIDELTILVNALSIVKGNYYVNNVMLNNGRVNYCASKFHSLAHAFGADSAPDTSQAVGRIRFDRIVLNNIYLNYSTDENSTPQRIDIKKTKVLLDLSQDKMNIQFRSSVQNFLPAVFDRQQLLTVEGAATKVGPIWNIQALNFSYNSIDIFSSGIYNSGNQQCRLKISSNRFHLKKLAPLLGFNQIAGGTSQIAGDMDIDLNRGTIQNLTFGHSSSNVLIKRKKFTLKIHILRGITRLTDDFARHSTSISEFSANYGKNSIAGSLEIKGINRYALLADVGFDLQDLSDLDFQSGSAEAKGKAKLLAWVGADKANSVDMELIDIRGNVQFSAQTNPFFAPVKKLKGEAAIGKSISLNVDGLLYDSPFSASAEIGSTLGFIAHNRISSITSTVNAKRLPLSTLLDDIDKISSKGGGSGSFDYMLNCRIDTLLYMNKAIGNVSGNIHPHNDAFCLSNLSANLYDGRFNGNIVVHDSSFVISGKISKMDVSEIFADNKNFGQEVITSQNIHGTLDADVAMNFTTQNGAINTSTMLLGGEFWLQNGKLKGMNKIKKLDKWLNLKEVESIDFNTLHNFINIKDGILTIPSMNIKSNVISISLDGSHSFSGKYEYHARINLTKLLASRFMNKSASEEYETSSNSDLFVNLVIVGNGGDYQIRRDKERDRQKLKADIKNEGVLFKQLMKEEFAPSKDTLRKPDSIKSNSTKLRIVWDDE